MTPDSDEKPKLRRGFAAMSPERRREIARLGGLSLAPEKRSFSQNRALAALAGKRGGETTQKVRDPE
jgi:general stress protein YciG